MASRRPLLLTLTIFVITAIIVTLPAFSGNFLKLTMDGGIHLSRLESVFGAFSVGKLPPLVNFIGLGDHVNAFNGMYPWFSTALFFTLPRLILGSPMQSMFVGYVLLNLVTMLNAYLLVKELSSDNIVRIFSAIFYGVNAYHLTLLFSREALGEAVAYTFAPLVMLGCLRIWSGKNKGPVYLAIGMGMIANSHVISLFLICLLLIVIEFTRIFFKKVNLIEIKRFLISGLIAALISCYSLLNIVKIASTNKMFTPTKGLAPVIPSKMVSAVLDNSIQDDRYIFNIGLVGLILIIFLCVELFKKDKIGNWVPWTVFAVILFICTTSWLQLENTRLKDSVFGNIQFLGRISALIVLLITIAITIYLEEQKVHKKYILLIISFLLILMGVDSILQFHLKKNDDPIRFYVKSDENFVRIAHEQTHGLRDYTLVDKNNNNILYTEANTGIKNYSGTSNSATFEVKAKEKITTVPINMYKNVDYHLYVDGKKKKFQSDKKILTINLKKGNHKIKLVSKARYSEYISMFVSCVSLIGCGLFIILIEPRKH